MKMKKYVDRVLAAKRAAKFVDKVTETGDDLTARRAELQHIADLLAQRTADIARIARDKLKSSLPNRPYSRRNDRRCLQNRHRIHSMM
ncbi:hypothetical protein ACXGR8_35295 [Nocardia gipuzkoensis]